MQTVKLGKTQLVVSRLCLGGFRTQARAEGDHSGTVAELESELVVRRALDVGINFFDAADPDVPDVSEELMGRALKKLTDRKGIVIATKAPRASASGRGQPRLSREALMAAVDASLRRLRTDYVDLYQVHRWDCLTSIEESLEGLHAVVQAGKVRYLGSSAMFPWQFAKSRYVAEMSGWTPFSSVQANCNLLYRNDEQELLPYCAGEGIGFICWDPLADGRLARNTDLSASGGARDAWGTQLGDTAGPIIADAVARAVGSVANARGVARTQVASAWLLSKKHITSIVVPGMSRIDVDAASAAMELNLTPEEVQSLEGPYQPRLAEPSSYS